MQRDRHGLMNMVDGIVNCPIERIDVTYHESTPNSLAMNEYIVQYYRCPERYIKFAIAGPLSNEEGFFRIGDEGLCYGQLARDTPSPMPHGQLCDVIEHTSTSNGITYLPFDVRQAVDNLRLELYS